MIFNNKRPVIFIHGLMGSMGEGILKGKGDLKFGISEVIYRPLINSLNELGYKEGENLFICYYDWTKGNMNSAKNYLLAVMEEAKKKTKSKSVDLICHSMGGIVARAYAQSDFYNYDINRLIMIATPNLGSAKAYYFWSGGDIISKEAYRSVLYKLIKNSFIWYIKLKFNKDIDLEFIREKIPSVKELLPSHDYGDYLILEENKKEIPIEDMEIQNDFLNNLNKNKDILQSRRIKTYMIIGKEIETIEKIRVAKKNKITEKWKDGKPIASVKTTLGDGTVTCDSIKAIRGKDIYIESDHVDILSNCKRELGLILNKRKGKTTVENQEFNTIYSIIGKDVEIKVTNDMALENKLYEVISKDIKDDIGWLMIKSKNKDISIDIKSFNRGKVIINKVNLKENTIEEKLIDAVDVMTLKI